MTTIIAEIGINHQGNLAIAVGMITLAKVCGADIAKFQLYDPDKLLSCDDFTLDDWEIIKKTKMDFYDVKFLKRVCDKEGIEFMASAFDLERLGWLEQLGVKRHKIASRSIYDREYCEAVKATGKPTFISLGMQDDKKEPYSATLHRLGWGKFMYCISEYPTPLNKIERWMMDPFKTIYRGFSDHTKGITSSQCAIAYGLPYVEKHFTLDKTLPGPDHVCSATPEELKALCKFRGEVGQMG